MCSGLTMSVARSCSKEVSMTVPSFPSSIPWAISSSPGASGIRALAFLGGPDRRRGALDRLRGGLAGLEARPLLGAEGVVALAPAEIGLSADEALKLVEPVEQRLGPGWTAGDVDVDRHELVRALDHGVVGEHPAG